MNKFFSIIVFVLLFGSIMTPDLMAQPVEAETEEEKLVLSNFSEEERKIIELANRQMPQLQRMEKTLINVEEQLAAWEDTLAYQKKIPKYRDKALRDVAGLRRQNDNAYDQLKELNMQWFTHQRPLMAVYTRYGELKIRGRINEQLRTFLKKHRNVMHKMEGVLLKINENYIQADFLLNSKLN
mgnify:CR=1 FL=1